jgi:hypothetical protein
MKIKAAFIAGAIFAIIFGIGLAFLPNIMIDLFDVSLNEDGIHIARIFGAALIGFAVIFWQVSKDVPSEARRNIILGETVHSGIASIFWIIALVQGLGNWLMWFPFLCHLVLALWFGYLYIKGAK